MNTIYIYNPDILLPQEWSESGMAAKVKQRKNVYKYLINMDQAEKRRKGNAY